MGESLTDNAKELQESVCNIDRLDQFPVKYIIFWTYLCFFLVIFLCEVTKLFSSASRCFCLGGGACAAAGAAENYIITTTYSDGSREQRNENRGGCMFMFAILFAIIGLGLMGAAVWSLIFSWIFLFYLEHYLFQRNHWRMKCVKCPCRISNPSQIINY